VGCSDKRTGLDEAGDGAAKASRATSPSLGRRCIHCGRSGQPDVAAQTIAELARANAESSELAARLRAAESEVLRLREALAAAARSSASAAAQPSAGAAQPSAAPEPPRACRVCEQPACKARGGGNRALDDDVVATALGHAGARACPRCGALCTDCELHAHVRGGATSGRCTTCHCGAAMVGKHGAGPCDAGRESALLRIDAELLGILAGRLGTLRTIAARLDEAGVGALVKAILRQALLAAGIRGGEDHAARDTRETMKQRWKELIESQLLPGAAAAGSAAREVGRSALEGGSPAREAMDGAAREEAEPSSSPAFGRIDDGELSPSDGDEYWAAARLLDSLLQLLDNEAEVARLREAATAVDAEWEAQALFDEVLRRAEANAALPGGGSWGECSAATMRKAYVYIAQAFSDLVQLEQEPDDTERVLAALDELLGDEPTRHCLRQKLRSADARLQVLRAAFDGAVHPALRELVERAAAEEEVELRSIPQPDRPRLWRAAHVALQAALWPELFAEQPEDAALGALDAGEAYAAFLAAVCAASERGRAPTSCGITNPARQCWLNSLVQALDAAWRRSAWLLPECLRLDSAARTTDDVHIDGTALFAKIRAAVVGAWAQDFAAVGRVRGLLTEGPSQDPARLLELLLPLLSGRVGVTESTTRVCGLCADATDTVSELLLTVDVRADETVAAAFGPREERIDEPYRHTSDAEGKVPVHPGEGVTIDKKTGYAKHYGVRKCITHVAPVVAVRAVRGVENDRDGRKLGFAMDLPPVLQIATGAEAVETREPVAVVLHHGETLGDGHYSVLVHIAGGWEYRDDRISCVLGANEDPLDPTTVLGRYVRTSAYLVLYASPMDSAPAERLPADREPAGGGDETARTERTPEGAPGHGSADASPMMDRAPAKPAVEPTVEPDCRMDDGGRVRCKECARWVGASEREAHAAARRREAGAVEGHVPALPRQC
jgi:hypothetical protein